MKEALLHLSKDKKLKKILTRGLQRVVNESSDLYPSLLKAIAGQQLSVKAANTIWNRFLDLFDNRYPDAKIVVETSIEVFRSVGFSYQKGGYLKNIAQFHIDHALDYGVLKNLNDVDLIEYLTQIKGVGKWTVQMLLMFNFGRKDIFPIDDLGIQNAIKKLYGFSETGKPLKLKMLALSKKWSPYCSIASFYLWEYKDNVT